MEFYILFKTRIIHHEGHEENEGKRIAILKRNGCRREKRWVHWQHLSVLLQI
jgi:hypothetical protein